VVVVVGVVGGDERGVGLRLGAAAAAAGVDVHGGLVRGVEYGCRAWIEGEGIAFLRHGWE